MKRIMVILAATAAILASCSKSEPESGIRNANITLNISVSNPSNSSKALIKSDWAVGDRILIWYDGNTQTEPDMAIKYDGSKWNNDTDVEVSVNTPAESGYLKALYDGAVKVTARDEYTYSNGILTARLQTWTFLTEIQVVVTGIDKDDADKYALSCSGFVPCTGITIGEDAITSRKGTVDSFVNGTGNADGVAFVFASANYEAGSFEFSIKDITSGTNVITTYIASKAIEKNTSRIKAIKTRIADYKPRDYVRIAGIKWTKENLAISSSGKRKYNNTNHVFGDFFQWAAYSNYTTAQNGDKGLLVYTSFTSSLCGDGSDKFTFKSGKSFNKESAPYGGSSFTKYTSAQQATLTLGDDVANIILGGNWRIPTGLEYKAMYDATFWAWDATDKGFYIFEPTEKHKAGSFNGSIPTDLNKANALLFFPASGYGLETGFDTFGKYCNYWTSSLYTADINLAYNMYSQISAVNPQSAGNRYGGFTVRAVSN